MFCTYIFVYLYVRMKQGLTSLLCRWQRLNYSVVLVFLRPAVGWLELLLPPPDNSLRVTLSCALRMVTSGKKYVEPQQADQDTPDTFIAKLVRSVHQHLLAYSLYVRWTLVPVNPPALVPVCRGTAYGGSECSLLAKAASLSVQIRVQGPTCTCVLSEAGLFLTGYGNCFGRLLRLRSNMWRRDDV